MALLWSLQEAVPAQEQPVSSGSFSTGMLWNGTRPDVVVSVWRGLCMLAGSASVLCAARGALTVVLLLSSPQYCAGLPFSSPSRGHVTQTGGHDILAGQAAPAHRDSGSQCCPS